MILSDAQFLEYVAGKFRAEPDRDNAKLIAIRLEQIGGRMTYHTDDNAALLTDFLRWLVDWENEPTNVHEPTVEEMDPQMQRQMVESYLRSIEPQWPAKDAENEK